MNASQADTTQSPWQLLLFILTGLLISLLLIESSLFVKLALLGLIIFPFLIKHSELSLAVLFNGTFLYFYSVFKLGFNTSSLLTGSLYGILAISCILGGVLITKKSSKFKFDSIDNLFISFFCMVFISYLLFSLNSENAFTKMTFVPFMVIAPYFGARLLTTEKRLNRFFTYCIYVAAILIVPAFYELLFNPDFAEYNRFSMYRFEGRGDNPILFGITFAILLIILSVWVVENKKLKFKDIVLIVPSMFFLLRSGSRGAVLAFFVTILFYLFFISKLRRNTRIYALFIIFLLTLFAYRIIPESTVEFYKYTFSEEARLSEGSSVFQRIVSWQSAVDNFLENPILGVGEGNVEYGYPHNIVLEVLSELGIVGFSLFFYMCFLTIKKGLNFIKESDAGKAGQLMKIALLLFIYALTEAMFSGHIAQQTHLFVSMGLIVSVAQLKGRTDKRLVQRASRVVH